MANIIREDVVKVTFDVGSSLKELQKLQNDVNELKKKLTGGMGDEAFEDLKKHVSNADDSMEDAKKSAQKLKNELTNLGKKAATTAYNGLKKVAGISFKALTVGISAVATGIGKITYDAIKATGEFEQLEGGMKKIFDQANIANITKDANNAYLELGMSARQYLGTINDVGANFASTMGDQKGYDTARKGLMAISDYASGTGKNVDLLSDKFTMITRASSSYQSIADQFSGILPATSKDFLKQAKAAGFLDKKYTDLTKVPIAEYQEAVAKMLEKGVANMGLAGNTAAEATGTLTGSLQMTKSAWDDLLVAFGSGKGFDEAFDKFMKSAEAFGVQLVPVAAKALEGIGKAVEKLSPIIADKLPELADQLLPPLIKAAVTLTKGLVKALPNIIKTAFKTIGDIIGDSFPALKGFTDFFAKSAGTIAKFIPVIIALVAAFKMFSGIKSITSIFGGLGGGKGGKGGKKGGMFSWFTDLAKMKTGTILKGMANLAIILGGFTLITAAFALIAPQIAKIGDMGAMLEMAAMISGVGLVGVALAKMGEIAGKIKVTTVLLGLANMAIMVAGMSALFLLLGAISLIKFDLGRVMAIVGIIGAIGLVGGALALIAGVLGIFGGIGVAAVAIGLASMAIVIVGVGALVLVIGAISKYPCDLKKVADLVKIIGLVGSIGGALGIIAGILGIIPFPLVLAGLVNIGLVLAGLTALIIKFGEFAQTKGVMQFVETGGALLAKVFNVLGECVGSIIGGIGEGITNSLPKIGENISAFAEAIKPMFSVFEGADMGGIGTFLKALGAFMLQMAGGKVLEFFAGKPDFAGVAEGLNTLAQSDGVKNFLNMVNGIEQSAFEKAKLFFECLDGIKSLPNTGGLAELFGGKNDFSGVATGLGDLAGSNVKNFFAMVAALETVAFDNAKLFFEALDGISTLPNVGGLSELFGGKNDFSGVANGLKSLSGEGVQNFFAMVSKLDSSVFEKTRELFAVLADIGNVGEEGFWSRVGKAFTGDKGEKSGIEKIASQLSTFAEKVQPFFAAINELNLDKLNGLWESLKSAKGVTASNLAKVKENITEIVEAVKTLPEKMGEGLKNAGESLSSAIVEVWKEAVEASVAPVNKLLDGANHILKEFGSNKRVIEWKPYARGTDGHRGGNALVNDGRGAELVQMPNGRMFVPNGRNVFLPNAPKGMKVLPADQTARLLGRKSPTFKYAKGIGDIDVWNYYDNAEGLVKRITDTISYKGMSDFPLSAGESMVSTLSSAMVNWVKKQFEEGGQSLSSYVASKGVTQWLPTVVRALKMENQYSLQNVMRTLFQMKTESGGNPKAINLWDSNAKKGTPSKGLMQVIDPTFRAYARKGFDKNIYDPLSNILASVRYATSRYGSLTKAYRGVGYSNGVGTITMPEQASSLSMSYTPESDSAYYTTNHVEYNTYAPQFAFTIEGSNDDRTLERRIKRVAKQAFLDLVDEIERNNPKVREV